jgi:hypothetical protein
MVLQIIFEIMIQHTEIRVLWYSYVNQIFIIVTSKYNY